MLENKQSEELRWPWGRKVTPPPKPERGKPRLESLKVLGAKARRLRSWEALRLDSVTPQLPEAKEGLSLPQISTLPVSRSRSRLFWWVGQSPDPDGIPQEGRPKSSSLALKS